MSLLALLSALTLIAYSNSCCVPDKFSAKSLVKTYREGLFYQGKGEVYYDYAAGMHASYINITVDEHKGIYSLVSTHYDINSGMVYTMTGGVCTKEKLDDSWMKETEEPHCISKLAVLDSTFALGGPHEDVELLRYLQSVKQGQRQLIVTRHHCYPVQEIYAKVNVTSDGIHVLDSTMVTLANLKLSVDDPSVFTLPAMCDKLPFSSKRNNDKNLPIDPWDFMPLLSSL